MNKMQKILAASLAAVLCLTMAGCGKEKSQLDIIKEKYGNQQPAQTPQGNNPAVSKPATSTPSAAKLPLDTTKDYQGLRLKRLSDRNDLISSDIKNNKNNKISSLKGNEPAYAVAVNAFNDVKKKGTFVAYKALEFHEFTPDSREFKLLVKQDKYKNATEYYRFTFEIYQYEKSAEAAKYDQYTDYSYDPHYLRVTVCNVNGQYMQVAAATSR